MQTTSHQAKFVHLLASTHFELVLCKANLGRVDETEAGYRRAIRYFRDAAALEPDDVENMNNVSSVHNNMCNLLRDRNELVEARSSRRWFEGKVAAQTALVSATGSTPSP
jgi:hypothetical protein